MSALTSDTFRNRRKQLATELQGGLVVLSAYELMQQSADMTHPFRQEANFLYLTGLQAPGWQMIYDGTRDRCWLVRPRRSEVDILFGGDITDEEVCQVAGTDEVMMEADFDASLRQLKRQHAAAYTVKPTVEIGNFFLNPAQRKLVQRLERIFASVNSLEKELANIRAVKQPEEIQLIKRAIAISAKAFATVQMNVSTYRYEYEVEAEFGYEFRKNNAVHAYSPIVAAGKNATILHYESNSARVHSRDLLLLDCGASYGGYNADITRTFALGRPSTIQDKTYQALLAAHQQIIKLITPGVAFVEYQKQVDLIMKTTLVTLGLLDDMTDEKTYRRYFPHAISHGLGIDVHESLGSSGKFQPGMVLTVEPGIYDSQKGLGIRIEDNILVTQTGRQNLSRAVSTELA